MTSENFTFGFVLGPLQFQSTGQTHIWPQNQQFGSVVFHKIFDTPTVKTTKTEPSFRKLNSSPTKLAIGMLFPAHLQARELCPLTYSLSLPRILKLKLHFYLASAQYGHHPSSHHAVCTAQINIYWWTWRSDACDTNHMVCTRLV